jgi:hypothetical protein
MTPDDRNRVARIKVAFLGLGFGTAAFISLLVCVLIWAGIALQYGTAVFETVGRTNFDLSAPTSLKEVITGIILGMFLSFAVSVFLVPFAILARTICLNGTKARGLVRSAEGFGLLPSLLICMFLAMNFGGLLLLLVPVWVSAFALVVGTVIVATATARP